MHTVAFKLNKGQHFMAALFVALTRKDDDRLIAGIRHTQSNEALDTYLPTGADDLLVNVLDRVGGRKNLDAQQVAPVETDRELCVQFATAIVRRNVNEKLRGERRVRFIDDLADAA